MNSLIEKLPETVEAFGQMRASLFKDSALDVKTKELIAVSSAVLMRCEKCMEIHAQRAKDKGATEDEIAEAIGVAMFIAGGSQLHWTEKYNDILKNNND
ncbi:AhpD family alkylhydroperoxidase [Methanohalophilus levihalophilus]|uniref:carboxymuconolactone decarboxylase family protein n=1 Tax=Methanohalophilus levihalophilus TaxID=1431282 RepID=UPI001AE5E9A8|nr:carboxymuconolactone decarboxylase family protein [Methanohalophilus levihalophilus]MBP2030533.1 AhpD family alkylhydroperoxidase [Methanohalophilus levihalophilus]